jgi:hypothetical protein
VDTEDILAGGKSGQDVELTTLLSSTEIYNVVWSFVSLSSFLLHGVVVRGRESFAFTEKELSLIINFSNTGMC